MAVVRVTLDQASDEQIETALRGLSVVAAQHAHRGDPCHHRTKALEATDALLDEQSRRRTTPTPGASVPHP